MQVEGDKKQDSISDRFLSKILKIQTLTIGNQERDEQKRRWRELRGAEPVQQDWEVRRQAELLLAEKQLDINKIEDKQIKLNIKEELESTMQNVNREQFGFYHTESRTFFYFQTQTEFQQFLDLYRRHQSHAHPHIEEMARPNLDAFNSVFDELNSSAYETGEELRELDF